MSYPIQVKYASVTETKLAQRMDQKAPYPLPPGDWVASLRPGSSVLSIVATIRGRVVGYLLCDLQRHHVRVLGYGANNRYTGINNRLLSFLKGQLTTLGRSQIIIPVPDTLEGVHRFLSEEGFAAIGVVAGDLDLYLFSWRLTSESVPDLQDENQEPGQVPGDPGTSSRRVHPGGDSPGSGPVGFPGTPAPEGGHPEEE